MPPVWVFFFSIPLAIQGASVRACVCVCARERARWEGGNQLLHTFNTALKKGERERERLETHRSPQDLPKLSSRRL